ncbi:hypothetical protein P7H02_09600, partial [Paenibacillus larvae]
MAIEEKEVKQVSQDAWRSFKKGTWMKEIDVNNFIEENITPYHGNEDFLAGATENTAKLWKIVSELTKKERENGG